MNTKINLVTGKAIAVLGDNIDTDRIIPARFLKEITFSNLGKYPFFDERFDSKMNQFPHPFNDPERQDAKILFVNKNFGCGSSREHAPQSLKRWGINAIVGESFAEIFASNCMAIGMPAVCVSHANSSKLQEHCKRHLESVWTIDLEQLSIYSDDISTPIVIKDHHREILLAGLWDSTSLLLENMNEVKKLHDSLPYTQSYK